MHTLAENLIIEQAKTILKKDIQTDAYISPTITKDFCQLSLADYEHEVFAVMFLNQRHQLIEFVEMFTGTIDGASVYPREVVKEALKLNAAAVVLTHNHPSGVTNPSDSDERITSRLKSALNLVDIRVLDHIVVGCNDSRSFAELGLL